MLIQAEGDGLKGSDPVLAHCWSGLEKAAIGRKSPHLR
ncbi:hypothetical protein XMD564_002092 [Marinobacterium sp. xm-d-564]|nr:hypothetical protein [Marinobacterium sp. xm-d-564]